MNRKQHPSKGHSASAPVETLDPIALHAAGVKAYRADDLDSAAALIGKAISANSHTPSFHYNLAIVLRARGNLVEAAASYERAILLKPDYGDAHNNLGNVWKMLGERDKARACFERALLHAADRADTHYNVGVLCSDAGDREGAAGHFQRCLSLDPADPWGAGMLLAQLGLTAAPQRTPQAQLLNIYDVRSRFWDREDTYFGHSIVAEGLQEHAGTAKRDILDIGCGTGLVGAQIRSLANRLDGVDISPAMLAKARAKKLYDRLVQGDLVSFMSEHKDRYDAVLAAATLIHFGNLQALFQAAANCLRDKGLFVFTVFSGATDDSDFAVAASSKLAQSGCYTHSTAYLARLAQKFGFSVLRLEKVIHEYDQDNNPVAGILAVLRREN